MRNFNLDKNIFLFLQTILDINLEHDLVFIKDSSLAHIYVNETFSQLFNKAPLDIIGKKDEEFFFDNLTLERCHESDMYVLENGYVSHEEIIFNKNFKVLKLKINLGNNKVGILCFAKQLNNNLPTS